MSAVFTLISEMARDRAQYSMSTDVTPVVILFVSYSQISVFLSVGHFLAPFECMVIILSASNTFASELGL